MTDIPDLPILIVGIVALAFLFGALAVIASWMEYKK